MCFVCAVAEIDRRMAELENREDLAHLKPWPAPVRGEIFVRFLRKMAREKPEWMTPVGAPPCENGQHENARVVLAATGGA